MTNWNRTNVPTLAVTFTSAKSRTWSDISEFTPVRSRTNVKCVTSNLLQVPISNSTCRFIKKTPVEILSNASSTGVGSITCIRAVWRNITYWCMLISTIPWWKRRRSKKLVSISTPRTSQVKPRRTQSFRRIKLSSILISSSVEGSSSPSSWWSHKMGRSRQIWKCQVNQRKIWLRMEVFLPSEREVGPSLNPRIDKLRAQFKILSSKMSLRLLMLINASILCQTPSSGKRSLDQKVVIYTCSKTRMKYKRGCNYVLSHRSATSRPRDNQTKRLWCTIEKRSLSSCHWWKKLTSNHWKKTSPNLKKTTNWL